jgi:hypothetical protein
MLFGSVFMFNGDKAIQLPDRPSITLCEAVTAFCHGKSVRRLDLSRHCLEEPTVEQWTNAAKLIAELRSAAYAGRIKFLARKKGAYSTDEHKQIDPLYFSYNRGFKWQDDTIWPLDPYLGMPDYTYDWHDVHLDRQQFEALLREIGVSVHQDRVAGVPIRTGMPGRPTSKHLVLELARCRLERGDCPPTLDEFSKQLADELIRAEPEAPRATPKTIANVTRKLWRARHTLLKTSLPA